MKPKEKLKIKLRRKKRVRAKIFGTSQRPRLSVSRSLNHIGAQLIDDQLGKTIASAYDREVNAGKTKTEKAFQVGQLMAQRALAKKISQVVFDKGAFKFHGRVKALADGAKEGGLKI